MKRKLLIAAATLAAFWAAASVLAGWFLLPPMLLMAPLPARTEAQRAAIRDRLCPPGCRWTQELLPGGQGRPLRVWRLRRPRPQGVALLLHGFGDDAWGAAPRALDLPGWDVVVFTFRGRDEHPEVPSTLGGWEGEDAAAVVARLEAEGVPPGRILLVGASQGAGVALLALDLLERRGLGPLGGALLESPFESLPAAALNHVKGTLGAAEPLARPAERLGLARAGRLAAFDPFAVSPARARTRVHTPLAILAGDADPITPLEGVRAVAGPGGDLTVVPGAGHMEAGARVPGGWSGWAGPRLERWGWPPLRPSRSRT